MKKITLVSASKEHIYPFEANLPNGEVIKGLCAALHCPRCKGKNLLLKEEKYELARYLVKNGLVQGYKITTSKSWGNSSVANAGHDPDIVTGSGVNLASWFMDQSWDSSGDSYESHPDFKMKVHWEERIA